MLLVDGTIYLNPDNGELVRMEGRLAKSPSFWTRRVEIVRWYRRIAGVPDADRARVGGQRARGRRLDVPDELRIREHQRSARRQSTASHARARRHRSTTAVTSLRPISATIDLRPSLIAA